MIREGSAPLTTTSPRSIDWRQHAACRNKKLDLFFPDGGTSVDRAQVKKDITRRAKTICGRCPVRQACADWALDEHIEYGIYGGLDETERRKILRARGAIQQSGPGRPLAPCGTKAAYERHVRYGEPIDDACRAGRSNQVRRDRKKAAA